MVDFLTLWESGGKAINTAYADKLVYDGSAAVSSTTISSGTKTDDYKLSY